MFPRERQVLHKAGVRMLAMKDRLSVLFGEKVDQSEHIGIEEIDQFTCHLFGTAVHGGGNGDGTIYRYSP